MSGLSRTPGKRVWANPHRGFESRPLRHWPYINQRLTGLLDFLPTFLPPFVFSLGFGLPVFPVACVFPVTVTKSPSA
jgi:hypothetical protein